MQVTRLEFHIHEPLNRYKETAMVLLACIVVACSARLEWLDISLRWSCTVTWAQNLLVRPLGITSTVSFGCGCLLDGLIVMALMRSGGHANVGSQDATVKCQQLRALHLRVKAVPDHWYLRYDGKPGKDSGHKRIDISDPWTLVAVKR